MADIKLRPLPERKPVKLVIHLMPELHTALQDYARIYAATYGREESAEVLVPAMLAAFLESDKGFAKARSEVRAGEKS